MNQSRYKPKYKICAQVNENIWGTPKLTKFKAKKWRNLLKKDKQLKVNKFFHDSIKVTPFARPLKQNYKNNLLAKQALKRYYGKLPEYQFHKIIQDALKISIQTRSSISPAEALANLLERRLESVVFRMQFASSIEKARQLVSHGHISVNGQIVKIGSFLIKESDVIKVHPSKLEPYGNQIQNNINLKSVPSYLEVNFKILSGIFVGPLLLSEIPYSTWMNFRGALAFYKH